ncbi:hypothetical protein [Streptomyces atratus]|uniref:hypothetical protein n=1 Tax=Streptomyces atratus TaxID=1893 RepID=UPI001300559D|nr:hypothetical protein [Streptomyces atratus]
MAARAARAATGDLPDLADRLAEIGTALLLSRDLPHPAQPPECGRRGGCGQVLPRGGQPFDDEA